MRAAQEIDKCAVMHAPDDRVVEPLLRQDGSEFPGFDAGPDGFGARWDFDGGRHAALLEFESRRMALMLVRIKCLHDGRKGQTAGELKISLWPDAY
jgi:hypothetical protein